MERPGAITTVMFKTCPRCRKEWASLDAFISDTELIIIGYQVNFKNVNLGFLLFNHSCKTTLSIAAGKFRRLYQGEIYRERKTGTDECPGYCLHECELSPCPAKCECAYVRDILQILRKGKA